MGTKYNIPVWDSPFVYSENYVEVEADSKEEALEIAYKEHGLKSIEQWLDKAFDALNKEKKGDE